MADELIALFGKITTNDHEQLVEQFSKILQVQSNVATFFLEASSWNVETAVHNYLASVGNNKETVFSSPPKAQFLGDLSPLQNRTFLAGSGLQLRLVFKNVGNEPWPHDSRLSFVDGEMMDGPHAVHVAAQPGEEVTILLDLYAPESSGTYMGSWRLACNAGYFGEPVYVILSVDGKQMDSGASIQSKASLPQTASAINISAATMDGIERTQVNAHQQNYSNKGHFVNGQHVAQQQLFQSPDSQQQQEDSEMLDL